MTSSEVCASGCGSDTYTMLSPTASVWPPNKHSTLTQHYHKLL
jgi:hypothetical protein